MHLAAPVLLVALSHCMGDPAQIPPFLLEVPGEFGQIRPKTRRVPLASRFSLTGQVFGVGE